jgi:hypothetical protein
MLYSSPIWATNSGENVKSSENSESRALTFAKSITSSLDNLTWLNWFTTSGKSLGVCNHIYKHANATYSLFPFGLLRLSGQKLGILSLASLRIYVDASATIKEPFSSSFSLSWNPLGNCTRNYVACVLRCHD